MAASKVTPEADQLHGQARPRAGVPGDDAGAARRARDPARSGRQLLAARDGDVRLDRRAGRHDDRRLGRRSRAHDSERRSRPRRGRAISRGPDTCFRCARAPAACSCAPDTPRPPSISRASPAQYPAGVICEVMNDDGTMARVPELTKFAREHGLLMITIADLIRYRMRTEGLVKRAADASLPTDARPVHDSRLREPDRRQVARRARARRYRRRHRRHGARALASA